MSTAKHTPGPWPYVMREIKAPTGEVYSHAEIGQGWKDGRYMSVTGCIAEEDARLIAAAPELLECLQEIIDHELEEDGATCEWLTLVAAVKRARSVVAKATGATHAP